MPQTFLTIRGVDPLLFRDGRPFTTEAGGLTARSLPLPFPTTVAAFVRSQIGRAMGWDRNGEWSHEDCQRAHGISVHGPLLLRDGHCVLPAPRDAVLTKDATPIPLRPSQESAGFCDLPAGMLPLMKPESTSKSSANAASDGKPPKGYDFWPASAILEWLAGDIPTDLLKISGLPTEERIGVEMDRGLGKAKEGMLYAAHLRAFAEKIEKERYEYALVARVGLPDGHNLLRAGTLGGERRMTVVEQADDTPDLWPRCPDALKRKLEGTKHVRMVLATPAHFKQGWKPDWIERSGSGDVHLPAGIANVPLKLVAAAIGRRVPVSGWGVCEGPRPVRWLVPAGSVFFFEVTGDNTDAAALHEKAWMKPMSDDEQDRRDGLGLALWGTW